MFNLQYLLVSVLLFFLLIEIFNVQYPITTELFQFKTFKYTIKILADLGNCKEDESQLKYNTKRQTAVKVSRALYTTSYHGLSVCVYYPFVRGGQFSKKYFATAKKGRRGFAIFQKSNLSCFHKALKKETNSQILCRAEELAENTEPVSMTSTKVIKLSRVSRYCANFLLCYNCVSWRYHPPFKEMTPAICCHSTLSLNEHYWRVLDCRLRKNIWIFQTSANFGYVER